MSTTTTARSGLLVAGFSGLGAVLLPKCPMCLAGYLSLVGLSLGSFGAAELSWLRIGLGVAAMLAASVVIGLHLHRRSACRCAAPSSNHDGIATPAACRGALRGGHDR